MEIVNADGSKVPVNGEVKQETPDPQPAFYSKIDPMTHKLIIEVNLMEISKSRQAQWQFMGFMDDHKSIGMVIVNQIKQEREAMKQAGNKGIFRNFLNGKK